MTIPRSHPRYESLKVREQLVKGINLGITSVKGLLAHGRGEAFDYILGEKTTKKAKQQIKKAALMLKNANLPVLSINGNVVALVAKEIVALSKAIPAQIEVNIFHESKQRELKIKKHLEKAGAKKVLLPNKKTFIKTLSHNRKYINPEGIKKADVIFAPLEDGDRCLALKKLKKKIITIDLNPKSRTAKAADICIVDNIIRTMPLLVKEVERLKK